METTLAQVEAMDDEQVATWLLENEVNQNAVVKLAILKYDGKTLLTKTKADLKALGIKSGSANAIAGLLDETGRPTANESLRLSIDDMQTPPGSPNPRARARTESWVEPMKRVLLAVEPPIPPDEITRLVGEFEQNEVTVEALATLDQQQLSEFGITQFGRRQSIVNAAKASLEVEARTTLVSPVRGSFRDMEASAERDRMAKIMLKDCSNVAIPDDGEELGRGGSGVVRKGTLTRRGGATQDVAVKMLAAGSTDDQLESFVKEIERHMEISARCEGVCTTYGAIEHEGGVCLVMKLYDRSLADDIQRLQAEKCNLDLAQCIAYAEQICRALISLHEQKVSVLDLKPQNLLFDEHRLVISDFGISAMAEQTAASQTKLGAGTTSYMAPEQHNPDKFGKRGPHSDIWALGCIINEMIGGSRPYPNRNLSQIIDTVCNKEENPEIAAEATPEVTELLRKCWAHQPADRLTANDVLALLVAIKQQLGHAAEQIVEMPERKLTKNCELVPMDERTYENFLTHKQATAQNQCVALFTLLTSNEMATWFDQDQPNITTNSMEEGVSQSRNFVIYLSADYMGSEYCNNECRWAALYGCNIIIIRESDPRHHPVDIEVERQRAPRDLKHLLDNPSNFLESQRREPFQSAMIDEVKRQVDVTRQKSKLPLLWEETPYDNHVEMHLDADVKVVLKSLPDLNAVAELTDGVPIITRTGRSLADRSLADKTIASVPEEDRLCDVYISHVAIQQATELTILLESECAVVADLFSGRSIEESISQSRNILIVLTDGYCQSDVCVQELQLAKLHGVNIIGIVEKDSSFRPADFAKEAASAPSDLKDVFRNVEFIEFHRHPVYRRPMINRVLQRCFASKATDQSQIDAETTAEISRRKNDRARKHSERQLADGLPTTLEPLGQEFGNAVQMFTDAAQIEALPNRRWSAQRTLERARAGLASENLIYNRWLDLKVSACRVDLGILLLQNGKFKQAIQLLTSDDTLIAPSKRIEAEEHLKHARAVEADDNSFRKDRLEIGNAFDQPGTKQQEGDSLRHVTSINGGAISVIGFSEEVDGVYEKVADSRLRDRVQISTRADFTDVYHQVATNSSYWYSMYNTDGVHEPLSHWLYFSEESQSWRISSYWRSTLDSQRTARESRFREELDSQFFATIDPPMTESLPQLEPVGAGYPVYAELPQQVRQWNVRDELSIDRPAGMPIRLCRRPGWSISTGRVIDATRQQVVEAKETARMMENSRAAREAVFDAVAARKAGLFRHLMEEFMSAEKSTSRILRLKRAGIEKLSNERNKARQTVLHVACYNGCVDSTRLILHYLSWAAELEGFEFKLDEMLAARDAQGYTPAMAAGLHFSKAGTCLFSEEEQAAYDGGMRAECLKVILRYSWEKYRFSMLKGVRVPQTPYFAKIEVQLRELVGLELGALADTSSESLGTVASAGGGIAVAATYGSGMATAAAAVVPIAAVTGPVVLAGATLTVGGYALAGALKKKPLTALVNSLLESEWDPVDEHHVQWKHPELNPDGGHDGMNGRYLQTDQQITLNDKRTYAPDASTNDEQRLALSGLRQISVEKNRSLIPGAVGYRYMIVILVARGTEVSVKFTFTDASHETYELGVSKSLWNTGNSRHTVSFNTPNRGDPRIVKIAWTKSIPRMPRQSE